LFTAPKPSGVEHSSLRLIARFISALSVPSAAVFNSLDNDRIEELALGRRLEAFNIVEFAQLLVDRSEGQVASLAGGLQDHAIGKAELGTSAESSQSSDDYRWLLLHQVSVVERHVNRGRELLVRQLEN